MCDEIRWRETVLVRWTSSRPRGNINLTVQLADLLTHSMMWFMQNSATEADRAVGLQVIG
jgi:hypothetical protein